MYIGPRNSVIAELMGLTVDWLFDGSPWIALVSTKWNFIKDDYPELWVDKLHDYTYWEDDDDTVSIGSERK